MSNRHFEDTIWKKGFTIGMHRIQIFGVRPYTESTGEDSAESETECRILLPPSARSASVGFGLVEKNSKVRPNPNPVKKPNIRPKPNPGFGASLVYSMWVCLQHVCVFTACVWLLAYVCIT